MKSAALNKVVEVFNGSSSSKGKLEILQQIISKISPREMDFIIDHIESMDRQMEFIACFSELPAKSELVKQLHINKKKSQVKQQIKREAKKLYQQILSLDKTRKGRDENFYSILVENIRPCIEKNEYSVVKKMIDMLISSTSHDSFKIAYAGILGYLQNVISIVRKIKRAGISVKSIESILLRNRERVFREIPRKLLEKIFLEMDKDFESFSSVITEILALFREEETKRKELVSVPNNLAHEFSELCETENTNAFLKKASHLYSLNKHHVNEIFIVFELFLFAPVLKIYDLLKFPGSMEALKKWTKVRTLPWLNNELESHFLEQDKRRTEKALVYKDGNDPEGLIHLIYDYRIDFTRKYTLIREKARYFPDSHEGKNLRTCLKAIEEVQYKFESGFLNPLLKQLYIYSHPRDMDLLIRGENRLIAHKINLFKKEFLGHVERLRGKISSESLELLLLVEKELMNEEAVAPAKIIALYRALGEGNKGFRFVISTCHFLIDYYMLLDSRRILNYFNTLLSYMKITDGLFLKHHISGYSICEIDEYCRTSPELIPSALQILNKFLKSAEQELEVEGFLLNKIPGYNGKSRSQNILLLIHRYKYFYSFSVKGAQAREVQEENVFCYLDFFNAIQNNGLNRTELFNYKSQSQYRTVAIEYLKASGAYVRILKKYLEFKIKLLESQLKYPDKKTVYEINLRKMFAGFLEKVLPLVPPAFTEERIGVEEEIRQNRELIEKWNRLHGDQDVENVFSIELIHQISREKIFDFFNHHRAAANRDFVYYLKTNYREIDVSTSAGKELRKFIGVLKLPDLIDLKEESVFEGLYCDKIDATVELWQKLITKSIEENILNLKELIHDGKEEVLCRKGYIESVTSEDDPALSMYRKEIQHQSFIIESIGAVILFGQEKLNELIRIKYLQDKAAGNCAKILHQTGEADSVSRLTMIAGFLDKIELPDERILTHLFLYANPGVSGIREKLFELLKEYKDSRFYFFVNLITLVEEEEDYYRQIRILHDVYNHINNSLLYFEALPFLNALKQHALDKKRSSEQVINEYWSKMPERDLRPDYTRRLAESAGEPVLKKFFDILKDILSAEEKERFIVHNISLPMEERLSIISHYKKLCPEKLSSLDSVDGILQKEKIEIQTRKSSYLSRRKRIFNPQTMELLFSAEANRQTILDSIRRQFLLADRQSVESGFKEQGFSGFEIIEYLDSYFPLEEASAAPGNKFNEIVAAVKGIKEPAGRLNYIKKLKQELKDPESEKILDLLYSMYRSRTSSPVEAVLKMDRSNTDKIKLLQWVETAVWSTPEHRADIAQAVETLNQSCIGKILAIDDETNTLHALKRVFRGRQFDFFATDKVSASYEILKNEAVDIVLSDYNMPEMDGMSFLKDVRLHYPFVIRLLYSAHLSDNYLIHSLNNDWAAFFFKKPWSDEALNAKLLKLLKCKKALMLRNKKIFRTINNTGSIPVLPFFYFRLTNALGQEALELKDLSAVVSADASITAKLLQVANSMTFGEKEVIALEEALKVTALSGLRSMASYIKTSHDFKWDSITQQHLKELYIHSNSVSRYVPVFYEAMYGKRLETHHITAASLIDIGKVILLTYHRDLYSEVISYLAEHPGLSYYEGEVALGLKDSSHDLFGGYLLHLWNIPSAVADLVLFHHSPDECPEEDREFIISLAYTEKVIFYLWETRNSDHFVNIGSFVRPGLNKGTIEDIFSRIQGDLKMMEKEVVDPFVYEEEAPTEED